MGTFVNRKRDTLLILFGGAQREETVLRLHQEGYAISAVLVPKERSPTLQKSVDRLVAQGVTTLPSSKISMSEDLKPFRNHLLLSIGFPYLISQEDLQNFRLCLNVHPTLLPQYRGPSSGAYILMNKEKESGSTVHVIDEGMDTGPIVLQRKVPLTPFDTIRSLQNKVYALEPELVSAALKLLEDPEFTPIPQNEELATTYPKKRKPEDSELDPTKPLLELYDSIRASDPEEFPAFFFIHGEKVCVRLWRPDSKENDIL